MMICRPSAFYLLPFVSLFVRVDKYFIQSNWIFSSCCKDSFFLFLLLFPSSHPNDEDEISPLYSLHRLWRPNSRFHSRSQIICSFGSWFTRNKYHTHIIWETEGKREMMNCIISLFRWEQRRNEMWCLCLIHWPGNCHRFYEVFKTR